MASSSRQAIREFSKQLAQEFSRRFPASRQDKSSSRAVVNKLTRIVEEMCEKARLFKSEYNLGLFGKSQLCNDFRWELDSLGYHDELIEFLTEAIIIHMSKKN